MTDTASLPLLLLGPKSTLPTASDAADSLCCSPAQRGHYWLSTLDTQAQCQVHLLNFKCCNALYNLFLVSHGVSPTGVCVIECLVGCLVDQGASAVLGSLI